MQYEICDTATAQNIGNVLFNFLVDIDNNGRKNSNNDPTTTSSSATTKETKLDLSTKASSLKPQREMQTILSSSNNKSSSARSSMYDASGKLIKQWANVKTPSSSNNNIHTCDYEDLNEDDDDDEVLKKQLERNRNEYIKRVSEEGSSPVRNNILICEGTSSLDDSSSQRKSSECSEEEEEEEEADERALYYPEEEELVKKKKSKDSYQLLKKSSSQGSAGERMTYDELELLKCTANERRCNKERIYDQDGKLLAWEALIPQPQTRLRSKKGGGEGEVNLSAKEAASKHHAELDILKSNMKQRGSGMMGQSIKSKIYNERGELVAWENKDDDNSPPSSGNGDRMDLSTKGSLKKKASELEALRATGTQRRNVKNMIYNEHGQLVAWNKLGSIGSTGGSGGGERRELSKSMPTNVNFETEHEPTSEENGGMSSDNELRRKEEFESIMRDRTLSREERSRRIQELKVKYGSGDTATTATLDSSSDNENETEGVVRLGAADAASKHHAELEFLRSRMKRGSVTTANAKRSAMYNSKGEIVQDSTAKYKGEHNSHNPSMDLSPQGYTRKKGEELDAIRSRRESVKPTRLKQRMYDEDGNLRNSMNNGWRNEENESGTNDEKEEEEWICETSAEGMKLKKVSWVLIIGYPNKVLYVYHSFTLIGLNHFSFLSIVPSLNLNCTHRPEKLNSYVHVEIPPSL